MRLRRMFVMFAAVACLGIGLIQATSAYAGTRATPSVASINRPKVPGIPDVVRSLSVDVTVYCGQFKGALYYYITPLGRSFQYQYVVKGTLYAKCGGTTAHLWAHFTPKLQSPKTELAGSTTGTENIDWGSSPYTVPISNKYVELCTISNHGGGCANSPSL